jgi:hypothetical protein
MERFPKVLLLLCLVAGSALGVGSLDKLWFIGYSQGYHERRGFLEFDDSHQQEIGKGNLLTSGAMVGKRFTLLKGFRLQVAGSLHYGKTKDDTLPSIQIGDTLLPAQMLSVLFLGGMVADLQYPAMVSSDASWYFHAGYGIHYCDIAEFETLNNDPKIKVLDDYLDANQMWSGSVHGGLGFEIAFTPMFGFAASYTLRYWYPVHYGLVRDLFPVRPIDYRERFISHEFDVVLLVKRY